MSSCFTVIVPPEWVRISPKCGCNVLACVFAVASLKEIYFPEEI